MVQDILMHNQHQAHSGSWPILPNLWDQLGLQSLTGRKNQYQGLTQAVQKLLCPRQLQFHEGFKFHWCNSDKQLLGKHQRQGV